MHEVAIKYLPSFFFVIRNCPQRTVFTYNQFALLLCGECYLPFLSLGEQIFKRATHKSNVRERWRRGGHEARTHMSTESQLNNSTPTNITFPPPLAPTQNQASIYLTYHLPHSQQTKCATNTLKNTPPAAASGPSTKTTV